VKNDSVFVAEDSSRDRVAWVFSLGFKEELPKGSALGNEGKMAHSSSTFLVFQSNSSPSNTKVKHAKVNLAFVLVRSACGGDSLVFCFSNFAFTTSANLMQNSTQDSPPKDS